MSHPQGVPNCPGSNRFPVREVTVQIFVYVTGHGECETCGHLFSMNKDGRIRKHWDDGCRAGCFVIDCRRGQREELPGSYIIADGYEAAAVLDGRELREFPDA